MFSKRVYLTVLDQLGEAYERLHTTPVTLTYAYQEALLIYTAKKRLLYEVIQIYLTYTTRMRTQKDFDDIVMMREAELDVLLMAVSKFPDSMDMTKEG